MAIILMDILITLAELINIQRVLSMLAIVHLTIEPTAMTVRIRTTTQRTPTTGDHSREIVLQYLQVTGFLVPWTDPLCLTIDECNREIAFPCRMIDECSHEIVLLCLTIDERSHEIVLLCRMIDECNREIVLLCLTIDERSHEIVLLCRMIEGCKREIALPCRIPQECNPETVKRYRITDEHSQEIVKYFLFRIDRLNREIDLQYMMTEGCSQEIVKHFQDRTDHRSQENLIKVVSVWRCYVGTQNTNPVRFGRVEGVRDEDRDVVQAQIKRSFDQAYPVLL